MAAAPAIIPSRVFRPTDNNFVDEISIALETLSPAKTAKNGAGKTSFAYEDENARDEFNSTVDCK